MSGESDNTQESFFSSLKGLLRNPKTLKKMPDSCSAFSFVSKVAAVRQAAISAQDASKLLPPG